MPPGLGRGTGLAGEVGKESRVGYGGPRSVRLQATQAEMEAPEGMHPWIRRSGDKNLGGPPWRTVSVAGVSMGGVYPEKEAGPQGPCWR